MPLARVIIFFIILALLAGTAQYYLQYRERYKDNSSFQIINFYKEEKNSVDAVFVGSSITFSFYSPLLVYNSYNIKTTNYSSSGMGILAYRYAIEEVRKYQQDALIVLSITPNYEMQYLGVHFMADYMPLSMNKIAFLTKYFTQDDESILNSIGFYATLMEYHDRWSEIGLDDLIIDEGIKGATRHKYYLSTINDISEGFITDDGRQPMPDKMEYLVRDLLDYCDQKNEKNIVFVLPPKTYSLDEYQQFNSLYDLISSRGYDVLDLRESIDDIGLFLDQDYYDINHTNIHGSVKYSDYLINYVMNNRQCRIVEDEDWDKALDKYRSIIDDYVLDIEIDMKDRDYFLKKPGSISLQENDEGIVISWDKVEGADGYIVYRKTDGGFKAISDRLSDDHYVDDDIEKGNTYTYTVIACRNDNGKILYGNYDYTGTEIEVKK